MDRQTDGWIDGQTDIYDSRVAFATEKHCLDKEMGKRCVKDFYQKDFPSFFYSLSLI